MRLLSVLRRYWFYSLIWLAGLWLLWLVTPIRPNIASTIYQGQDFIGFVDGGRAFVTLSFTKIDPKRVSSLESQISHGPASIRNTETGEVEKGLFTTDDRFVTLQVEPNRDHLLRSVRKQGKNADGNFKYQLEWINARTGKTFASFNPTRRFDFPESLSTTFQAALSPDGRYAAFVTTVDNKDKIVCEDIQTGQRIHTLVPAYDVLPPVYDVTHLAFSPDGRYLEYDLPSTNEGLVIVEMSSGQTVLRIPPGDKVNWRIASRWSPDGKLLFINDGSIWNLKSKQVQARVPIKSPGPLFFTDDSKQIISTHFDDSGVWLTYFDVGTGREVEDKRLLVMSGVVGSNLVFVSALGRFVLVSENGLEWNYESISGILGGGLNYLHDFFSNRSNRQNRFNGYDLVDSQQNKVIMSGHGYCNWTSKLSPDGRFLFVDTQASPKPWSLECWHVPQQKAIDAFLFAAAVWLIGCALLRTGSYFLLRRRKPTTAALAQ
jgi:hypothetical protein